MARKHDHQTILSDYASGLSFSEVASRHGCDLSTAYEIVKKAGINRPRKAGVCDHKFFSTVDCESKAYWLGFLNADGCVCTKNYKNTVTLALNARDIDAIEHFKQDLQTTNKIHIRPIKGGYRKAGFSAAIQISSPQIVSDLGKFGIVPNKTGRTTVPSIATALYPHFWRGMVDGDGYISISTGLNHGHRRSQFVIGLVGDYDAVEGFRAFCHAHTGTRATVRKHYSIYDCSIRGGNGLAITKLLYDDATRYLDRKKRKYLEYIVGAKPGHESHALKPPAE